MDSRIAKIISKVYEKYKFQLIYRESEQAYTVRHYQLILFIYTDCIKKNKIKILINNVNGMHILECKNDSDINMIVDFVGNILMDKIDILCPNYINIPKHRNRNNKKFKDMVFKNKTIPKCKICKIELTRESATVDHIVPSSRGGLSVFKNMRLLCQKCNNFKLDKILFRFM